MTVTEICPVGVDAGLAVLASNDFPVAAKEASAAEMYLARKWRPLPLPYKTKTCKMAGWPNYVVKAEDLPTAFAGPCNVGVLLGASNLTDVDVDSQLAAPFVGWLPPTE